MIILFSVANAATLTVDASGGADHTTINDAIDAASDGDTIFVEPGTYEEAINYDGKTLRIESTSGPTVTILDPGGSASWAIRIRSGEGEGTALVGFTVRNSTYAGAWLSGSAALFENVLFEDLGYTGTADNANLDDGGAIHIVSGTYTFTDVTFSNCRAKGNGGALFIDDGDITLHSSLIDGSNAGGSGGGIWMDDGTLTLSSSSMLNNGAASDGGAIYSSATLTATDVVFQNNQVTDAASDGGALHLTYATADLTYLTVEDNSARAGSGGGLWADNSALRIASSSFSRNAASRNGGHIGLNALTEELDLDNVALHNGRAEVFGGAIYGVTNASLILNAVSITDNKAGESGGGIYLVGGSSIIGTSCSFIENIAAEGSGGGLYMTAVVGERGIELTQSTFVDNEAKYQGGGISASNLGLFDISEVTFSGNSGLFEGTLGGGLYLSEILESDIHQSRFSDNAASIGGGAYALDASGQWRNNIFWENHAEVGGALSLSQGDFALSNNTFAGNSASREAYAISLHEFSGSIDNTIISHHDGNAVYVYDAETAASTTLSYNNWYSNTVDVAGEGLTLASTSLAADPRYAAWPPQGAFTTVSFVLSPDSSLINAGDPSLLDPDSTPSDIGAWGGPMLIVEDADGDGYDSATDCDDDDSSIYPGATETWYDGDNSDCVPDDDYDADGDGVASDAYGGEDCDDTDPDIVSDCAPDASDTGTTSGRGCDGCSGSGGAGVFGLWALLAVISRGRRPSPGPR